MATTEHQLQHAVLPTATHDERAREEIVRALKRNVVGKLVPGVAEVWAQRVGPTFETPPETRGEVRRAMLEDPFVRTTFSLRRIVQEQVWDATAEIVGRQIEDLNERAEALPTSAGGTLRLDPDLEVPPYLKAVDIHAMPTGYWDVATDGYDVAAGAMYDRGVYLYALGQSGPLGDSRGRSIVFNFFAEELPDLRPKRILDMGCTVGHSLLPYAELYPDAEIHGIDVGPGVLRYAHARAESLGRKVHFSQQNAEHTDFPDGHFDLITSHILLHETSRSALRNIFAECHRLLAPGGYMMHAEVPQYEDVDPFTQFMLDYDTYYNNEPFWGAMHDTDLTRVAVDAGFSADRVRSAFVASGRREGADRTGKAGSGKAAGQLQLTVAQR
jgi:2-polyprenyl-3-methyl-5-hydroxy-6-metoxy-1,4-benzoquinol methylase